MAYENNRGAHAIYSIEDYCVCPFGPTGVSVRLSMQEQHVVRYIYDRLRPRGAAATFPPSDRR
jgi:hypothetical protein